MVKAAPSEWQERLSSFAFDSVVKLYVLPKVPVVPDILRHRFMAIFPYIFKEVRPRLWSIPRPVEIRESVVIFEYSVFGLRSHNCVLIDDCGIFGAELGSQDDFSAVQVKFEHRWIRVAWIIFKSEYGEGERAVWVVNNRVAAIEALAIDECVTRFAPEACL